MLFRSASFMHSDAHILIAQLEISTNNSAIIYTAEMKLHAGMGYLHAQRMPHHVIAIVPDLSELVVGRIMSSIECAGHSMLHSLD